MRMLTVFNILAVAFLFLSLGMVVVPDAESRHTIATEVSVVRALQRIAVAQMALRNGAGPDRDADGTAEFAFLPDLMAAEELPLGPADPAGIADFEAGAYRIAVLLPDEKGRPVPRTEANRVDPVLAAKSFLVLAWPIEAGRGARRAYALHHDMLVHESPNHDLRISGRGIPDVRLPRLAYREQGSGAVRLPAAWPSIWRPFLEGVQALEIRQRLQARGLTVPENILLLAGAE